MNLHLMGIKIKFKSFVILKNEHRWTLNLFNIQYFHHFNRLRNRCAFDFAFDNMDTNIRILKKGGHSTFGLQGIDIFYLAFEFRFCPRRDFVLPVRSGTG